jgi:glucosyl-dolichyl phosphate glucuronosyltransferase
MCVAAALRPATAALAGGKLERPHREVQRMMCDVSIVVPTYNRSALLARTLDSLLRQEAGAIRYEVIVVDNNSVDDTRAVVGRYCQRSALIRYVFEAKPGASCARNTGIAASSAPVVAFIDDDVEASPGWVAAIKRALDARPDVDCVGGRIDARWVEPPPPWLTQHHWGPIALQAEKGATPYVDADNASPCLLTANFACRREALEAVGGFSPEFMRDEDRELQMRLWQANKRGMYVDDIVVSTEVPQDRLTKSHHRRHQARVGSSHARMQYLDRLDREGRLVTLPARRRTLMGAPGFLYRDLLFHAASWMSSVVRARTGEAFFHETRVWYFAGYLATRMRHHRRATKEPHLRAARRPALDSSREAGLLRRQ